MQPPSSSPGHPTTSSRSFFEFLVVRAGDQPFAVDVRAAVEIRGKETFDRPDSEDRRTLTVRDKVLPVADLRRLSGLPAFTYTCPAMLLIRAGVEVVALAVDEVGDIDSVPGKRVQPASNDRYAFCTHSVALGGTAGDIPLIDPALLLAA